MMRHLSSKRNRCRAGLGLLELLIVMAMSVTLAISLTMAFSIEVTAQRQQEAQRATLDQTASMEREIRRLLTGARLSASATDTTTYFTASSDGGASDTGVDRITFTTTAPGVPMASLSSTDDSQTQESARGPVGGLSEVSLGMTAIGSPPNGETGLFERVQRPSDSDPTQGGNESLLNGAVQSIGFEFWDGQQWEQTWDTTTMTTKRLPGAVQVTYRLTTDTSNADHVFVVTIPASDVTAQNPVTSGTATGTTGTQ